MGARLLVRREAVEDLGRSGVETKLGCDELLCAWGESLLGERALVERGRQGEEAVDLGGGPREEGGSSSSEASAVGGSAFCRLEG